MMHIKCITYLTSDFVTFQILWLRHECAHLTWAERVIAVATDFRVFTTLHESRLLTSRFCQSLQTAVVWARTAARLFRISTVCLIWIMAKIYLLFFVCSLHSELTHISKSNLFLQILTWYVTRTRKTESRFVRINRCAAWSPDQTERHWRRSGIWKRICQTIVFVQRAWRNLRSSRRRGHD